MVTNQAEVQLVYDAVSGLVKSGLSPSDIAVISMYRQQIKLLTVALVDFKGIEILTADKAQGRDKECVLVSFVRSNEDKKVKCFPFQTGRLLVHMLFSTLPPMFCRSASSSRTGAGSTSH